MEQAQEKRQVVRFKAPFYVKYNYASSAESGDFSAIAKDVSMKGVRILLEKSLRLVPDEILSLYFLFPSKRVNIYGKVMWAKEYDDRREAGVSFVSIPDQHKQDIHDYIFTYYPQEFTRRWWDGVK